MPENQPNQSTNVTSAALILAAASLISRILGLFRDRVLAGQFGAGDVLDAYYLAFRMPDFIYNIIFLGSVSAGFIPIFMKYLNKDPKAAWRLANNALNILLIGSALLSGVIFIFNDQITEFMAPNFTGEKLELAKSLSRVLILSPIFLGISALVSSILQTHRRFIWYSLPPIFYNLGIIIGVLYLTNIFGPVGLGLGVILGTLLHLLIQLPGLIGTGYRYRFVFDLKDKALKELFFLTVPRTMALGLYQFNILIITFFAASLATGSLSVFNFANNLISLPHGVIGASYAIAIFPVLANLAVQNKLEDYAKQLSATIRILLFFIVPLTIAFILLRVQLVRVVLGSGQFNWEDTILTMQTLGFLALGLIGYNLLPTLVRAFYALEDTWTPFYISVLSAILIVPLCWVLVKFFGIEGLALAVAIDATIKAGLMFYLLKRRVAHLKTNEIVSSLAIVLSASFFMAIAIQLTKNVIAPYLNFQTFWGIFTQGMVAGLVGMAVYIISCKFFKSPEVEQLQMAAERRVIWLTHAWFPVKREVEPHEVLK